MIDPSLCIETPPGQWASASWLIYSWLTDSTFILPILLAWTGLPWLTRFR